MSERVFADEFYKGFFREGDFLAFIEEREENSDWEKVKSSELRFYPIADGHRASSMLEEKLREKGKECVFKDTMEHTRLILKVRDELYPIRSCAIKTILERARVSGNALNKVQKTELAQILNYCMKVAGGDALLRFCEDKISAVHGGDASDYAVLKTPELFRRTVEYLQDNFSGYTFAGASYDHSIVTAVWSLDNEEALLKEYKESLQTHGLPCDEIQLGLRLTTSDTGQSGANLYPMIFFGSELRNIPLGSPLKLHHKNKADLARFDEQLNLLYAQYSKALGNMQSMMDVYVLHPINAMLGVMKRIGIPKKYATLIAEDYRLKRGDTACSAYEAYLQISEVIYLMQCDGAEGSKIVMMEENIARAVHLRWKDYDFAGEYHW
ncbi:transposase [Firmicutes bacterium AM29-6AC]|uniref:Uncharacterized protein n=1 Tax=Anaerotignum faecicola TaxID=2358141 RepID=A0A401LA46_9FIRM|nr:transposase [Anaerotignum faecicola]RHR13759.1 transposase [Firmicutes bacterium AF19-2LB]RHT39471.1 transposase [Firmicutes bacterium AM29-6AC]GCB28451.1 hypothetical protein KGMB03357_01120 [Anaerotignum faecicola]